MLSSNWLKNGPLRILNDLDSAGRGKKKDEEEGGTSRKEGQGGRRDELFLPPSSLLPPFTFLLSLISAILTKAFLTNQSTNRRTDEPSYRYADESKSKEKEDRYESI